MLTLRANLKILLKVKVSFLKNIPEVLEDFTDIIGGEYAITQNDQLYYIPKGTKLRLTMDQSSSAVRSLLGLVFICVVLLKKEICLW